MQKIQKLIVSIALLVTSIATHAKEITLWSYYSTPPFVYEGKRGLVADTVDFLNQELKGQFKFKLKLLPRPRIDRAIKKGKQGAVLFVNWIWMGKGAKDKYLWSKPLINDQNVLISAKKNQFNYSDVKSLIGLKFGAVMGRKHPIFEPLYKNDQLKRLNLNTEAEVLQVLLKGRVDITTQPLSQITALSHQLGINDKVHIADKPLYRYQRHILITSKLPRLQRALNKILKDISINLRWQSILSKHNLSTLAIH